MQTSIEHGSVHSVHNTQLVLCVSKGTVYKGPIHRVGMTCGVIYPQYKRSDWVPI